MKSKKTKIILTILFGISLIFVSANFVLAADQYDYRLLETLPGFFQSGTVMTDFPAFILAIYKFGIWTVGIAGLFMITIGGFMYMASAGNNATAESAKKIIQDALLGVAVALCAYLILYVINPDLTKINITFPEAIELKEGTNKYYETVGMGEMPKTIATSCTASDMLAKIKSASGSASVDPCVTFALLSTESGCNPNAQSAYACGIAQIKATPGSAECASLKSDIDGSIKRGISELMDHKSKVRGSLSVSGKDVAQALRDLYAGYNGGHGALSASNDCTDPQKLNDYGYPFVKWDCPINAGSYGTETVRATSRFLAYYNRCKSNNLMK
jgi:soluble lytic murein transglycosylase-like protein